MILPTTPSSVEATSAPPADWQEALRRAIRSGRELCEFVGVSPKVAFPASESDFPVLVPREFASRIRRGDPNDPILRQIVAASAEQASGGTRDPVGDEQAALQPGMLRKYQGRVLLVASGACAVHCRYCFRRHFPYQQISLGRAGWQAWLDTIAADPSIEEIILSGGDPLTVSDRRLSWFLSEIAQLPPIRRVRIHTRLPVVLPARVTPDLLSTFEETAQPIYVVLHINHAQEIGPQFIDAAQQLRRAGATLLNQAVLLRGVNDQVDSLADLSLRLLDLQIQPYYLHQLDPVEGAMHFDVSDHQALHLVRQLRERVPGYGVPQLVREIAGRASKTPIADLLSEEVANELRY